MCATRPEGARLIATVVVAMLGSAMLAAAALTVAALAAKAAEAVVISDAGDAPTHAVSVPLCAGLTIVTAISEPAGDYETIKSIESLTDRGITLHVSAQRRIGGVVRNFTIQRAVLPADLKTATLYMHNFMPKAPIAIPGSTALGTSAAVLHALKTTGAASISLVDASNSALSADRAVHPNVYDFRIDYALTRVDTGPATMAVTIDGKTVDLPVVRARGTSIGDRAELVFLDDEENPLTLALRIGSGGSGGGAAGVAGAVATPAGGNADALRLQVVRISTNCDAGTAAARIAGAGARANRLEQALAVDGRADIYDIFFDFASDRLREESTPTLKEIGEVMRRHPEWRVSVEGHTDGIASAAYNLDLSRRRAATVREALVLAHGVAADRLSSTGYGESRPRASNDTLEGRARNRRVELVRQ